MAKKNKKCKVVAPVHALTDKTLEINDKEKSSESEEVPDDTSKEDQIQKNADSHSMEEETRNTSEVQNQSDESQRHEDTISTVVESNEVSTAENTNNEGVVSASKPTLISEHTVEEGQEWTTKSRLDSFVQWCGETGIIISPKVALECEGTCHRYGLRCKEEVEKGELLCTIPRSLILNPDNGRVVEEIIDFEEWLDSIGQSLDDSSGWATLVITLLIEFNDSSSLWAPYLRLARQNKEYGHPMFWKREEMSEELKGTTLLQDMQRDIYNIESEYKDFVLPFVHRYKDVCGSVDRYDISLYIRLIALVMSNSITEDFGSLPSLIPVADLMNHSINNNSHLVFEEDCVKIVSLERIKKGCEILNTSGRLGNAELLQMYGYTYREPNVFDTLPVLVNTFLDTMEKSKGSTNPYFLAKVALLNKTEIASSDDYFLFDRNGMRRGPDIVQMLKILFMTEDDFEDLLRSRCGNRPDSFYQKLLRKLKLVKRTDTSSGVAIIDITDDGDQDQGLSSRKRTDEGESGDEPPAKRLNTGTNGSNCIVIDESDDEDENVLTSAGVISTETDINVSESDGNAINCNDPKGVTCENDCSPEKQTTDDLGKKHSSMEEVNSEEVDTVTESKKNSASVVSKDNPISISVDNVEEKEDAATKGTVDDDSDIDEVEFVSEDIRCKLTYGKLAKELKPEWKTFLKSVLNRQMSSMKQDDGMTLEEAQEKLADWQFYAYQVRRSHRTIVRTFLIALTKT